MKKTIITLILLISISSFAITKDIAADFFKSQHSEFISDITPDAIEISKYSNKLYLISDEFLEEAYIVYEKNGILHNHFDDIAKKLGTIYLVVQKFHYDFTEFPILYTSHSNNKQNFSLKIDDYSIISELLRRVHFYSNAQQLNLQLIQNIHIYQKDPHYDWGSAYLIKNSTFNKASGVSVALTGFAQYSPEIYDGDVSSLLRDPPMISRTPFTEDNIVRFSQWSMWADSIVNESGEVVANRATIKLVKYGPFAFSVEYKPTIIEQFQVD